MNQFITVIAQELAAKIQLNHLVIERSDQFKVWKHFTPDDIESGRASCIHCSKKYHVKVVQLAVFSSPEKQAQPQLRKQKSTLHF